MTMNGIGGSMYSNPMFQNPPQTTGGKTVQQTTPQMQQVQQGPREESQEGMSSQRVEDATNAESTEKGRLDIYA
jgi:hypothetical protein